MSMEDDSEINIGAPENEHLFPTEVKTIQLNQRHEDAAFDYQQHSYHSVPDKQNDRGASLSPPPLQNGYKEKGATLRGKTSSPNLQLLICYHLSPMIAIA